MDYKLINSLWNRPLEHIILLGGLELWSNLMYIISNLHNHNQIALVIVVYDLQRSIGKEISRVKYLLGIFTQL